MMLRPPGRKPKRLYSAVAVVAGAFLLWFEVSRLRGSGGEGWFWILVAGLMIVMGLVGVFQRADAEDDG